MKKILVISTKTSLLKIFFAGQLKLLNDMGQLYVCSNVDEKLGNEIKIYDVDIERKPNIKKDLFFLLQLIRIIFIIKPDLVVTLMPKSGLIGMLAATLMNVKKRVHIFTGQVWAGEIGIKRYALKIMDKIIGICANYSYADSYSQKEFLIAEKVVKKVKIGVVGHGSISGVDINVFQKNIVIKERIRKELGYSEESFLILYVGRLNEDKGIDDILKIASKYSNAGSEVEFLVIGKDEENYADLIEGIPNCKYLPHVNNPEEYMAAANVLLLPSRREGFGNVIIEAGACSLPVISTDIYGLQDSVIDQVNGIKYDCGNTDQLIEIIDLLKSDIVLCIKLGEKGRQRAVQIYSKEFVLNEWNKKFREMVG